MINHTESLLMINHYRHVSVLSIAHAIFAASYGPRLLVVRKMCLLHANYKKSCLIWDYSVCKSDCQSAKADEMDDEHYRD